MSNTPAAGAYSATTLVSARKTVIDAHTAVLRQSVGGLEEATLNISGGALTPVEPDMAGVLRVDTQVAATPDDLDTIDVTNYQAGAVIAVRPHDVANVVTLKDQGVGGDGSLHLRDSYDVVLSAAGMVLWLQRRLDEWWEIGRYGFEPTTVVKTAAYQLLPQESGNTVSNEGAGGAVVVTLPEAAAGLEFHGYVHTAQTLTFKAKVGDTIRQLATVSADAGVVESATLGTAWTVVALNAAEWGVRGVEGAPTVT